MRCARADLALPGSPMSAGVRAHETHSKIRSDSSTAPGLWPAVAYASNGVLILVVGIPLLPAACAFWALMLVFRSRKPARIAAVVLFAPTLAYSLYVSLDAVELLKHIGSENSMIGLAFFGLLVLSCVLFYMVARNRSARG